MTIARKSFIALIASVIGIWGIYGFIGYARHTPATEQLDLRLVAVPSELVVHRKVNEGADHQSLQVRLLNKSNAPIQITQLGSTCGCTLARRPEKMTLAIGEETLVMVEVEVPHLGVKETAVKVEFAGLTSGSIHIPIRLVGEIRKIPFVEHFPERLDLRVPKVEAVSKQPFEVVIIEKENTVPLLVGFDCVEGCVVAHVVNVNSSRQAKDEVRRTYACEIEVIPTRVKAPAKRVLMTAKTRDGSVATLPQMEINIQATRNVRVVPAGLLFRKSQVAKLPAERTVVFVDESESLGEIELVNPVSWIQVEPIPSNTRRSCPMKIRLIEIPESHGITRSVMHQELKFRAKQRSDQEILLSLAIELPEKSK